MQKPSECHKLTSDNNIIQFKKPVHDPFKLDSVCRTTPVDVTVTSELSLFLQ